MTMSEEESEEFRILRDSIRARSDAMERNEELNEFRRALARIVKPAALAASVTPYDAALGDLAYAAGELLDPEGDPQLAAMAAGTGLLTGGAGSGAMAARMAKKARTDAPYPMKRTEPYEPQSKLTPPTPIEREASLAGARSYQHAAGDPDMRKGYIDQLKRDLSKDESNDGYITDEMITDYMLSNNIRF